LQFVARPIRLLNQTPVQRIDINLGYQSVSLIHILALKEPIHDLFFPFLRVFIPIRVFYVTNDETIAMKSYFQKLVIGLVRLQLFVFPCICFRNEGDVFDLAQFHRLLWFHGAERVLIILYKRLGYFLVVRQELVIQMQDSLMGLITFI
jgi:hypothetical protein